MVELIPAAPRIQQTGILEPFHTSTLPNGTVWTLFYRTDAGFLLRFPHLADFEVAADGRRVISAPVPGVSAATVDHLYLNQVLPLALSKQGALVFHASAVEVDGGAIAFLANSGRGKSTLAAAFAVNGHRFLTDDGLVLEIDERGYTALPSHPSIRLWDDTHERLLGRGAEIAPRLHYTSKARLLAGPMLPHCDQSRHLLAGYLLGDGSAGDIEFRQLTESETLVAWARHSFLLDVEDKALIGAHFDHLAVLANSLPCYHLDYPRRYEDLGRLMNCIVEHAGKLRSPA